MTRRSIVSALALGIAAAGCASYYKVTEPASGKEFYTQEVSRKLGAGGSIEFKDAKTGATTTLQNSQVLEIDKKAYEAGLAAAKAAPAASPAATPPAAPAGATAATPAPTPQ